MKLIFLAAGMAIGATAWAAPAAAPAAPAAVPVQTRDVPVNDFMQGRLPAPIALNVPVPVEFAQSNVKRIGYSYWMRPADAATATAEKLPNAHGYMYGSMATSVTYDALHKVFYGIDDPGSLAKLKESAANVQVQQFKGARHPAVMVSMISRTTGQPAYFMYMSTGVKKDVFFLVLRAPDGRPDFGAAVWAKLAANIK
jgi:hypothetical protein